VKIEVRRHGNEVMIRVSDEGRGISPEMLPKIFDLFVQSDQTIDRAEGGLGIGLTLLRSLVQLHDGRVEAHSDGPGKGSTFTVWLPLVSGRAAVAHEPQARDGRVRSVVIVEDQPDSRLMLQLLLESQGIEVFTASNGLEGAELIERIKPEVALVDLGLPVMSGFDLARRIRGDGNGKYTKLVALSGYGQEEDVAAALAAGFDEHLTKPTDVERLERLLER
jgi:two-component system CheB/CheR fusion protein